MTRYQLFDLSRLKLRPIQDRKHDLDMSVVLPLRQTKIIDGKIRLVAEKIKDSRNRDPNRSVVLMMGAHVIRSGVQRYLIDIIKEGFVDCIATNGAGVIHDYELALVGATTESVDNYIRIGEFGLWQETGQINEIVKDGAKKGLGLGEAIGRHIEENNLPYKDISLLANAFVSGVPVTVHVGIGYDIVHEHPNFDGEAYGKTSYTDFLIFAKILESLSGGVVMNFGSAVMAPEVFLKALAMVRNVAAQEKRQISGFTCLVCDIKPLTGPLDKEPEKNDPQYYFRPWKTMLVRTVTDGGQSYYVCGKHSETIPQLWSALIQENT